MPSNQPDCQRRVWYQPGGAELGTECSRRLLHRHSDRNPRSHGLLLLQLNHVRSEVGLWTSLLGRRGGIECDVQQQHRRHIDVRLWCEPLKSSNQTLCSFLTLISLCAAAPCLPDQVAAELQCGDDSFAVQWEGGVVDVGAYTAIAIGSDNTRVSCDTTNTSCSIGSLTCGLTYSIVVTTPSVDCGTIKGSDYRIQSGMKPRECVHRRSQSLPRTPLFLLTFYFISYIPLIFCYITMLGLYNCILF